METLSGFSLPKVSLPLVNVREIPRSRRAIAERTPLPAYAKLGMHLTPAASLQTVSMTQQPIADPSNRRSPWVDRVCSAGGMEARDSLG